MRYLLDTHVMLWFLEDSNELSKKSRKLLIDSKMHFFGVQQVSGKLP